METQIPIYRAKKIDSDEYVDGWLNAKTYNLAVTQHKDLPHYTIETEIAIWRIDPSTLAIHFPDMIDSEGTKIFASLSEDGKGGDKCSFSDGAVAVALLDKGVLTLKTSAGCRMGIIQRAKDVKVSGIKE